MSGTITDTVMTAGVRAWVADALEQRAVIVADALTRFTVGDWGDLDAHDRSVNERALPTLDRLMGAYTIPHPTSSGDTQLWVILEPGHHRRIVLFPSEY